MVVAGLVAETFIPYDHAACHQFGWRHWVLVHCFLFTARPGSALCGQQQAHWLFRGVQRNLRGG
jgi:hypothetical protein